MRARDRTASKLHSTVAGWRSAGYEVASRHSNLIMTLTWTDPGAALALRATIIGCGEHTGCQIGLTTPAVPAGPEGLRPAWQALCGRRGWRCRARAELHASVTFDTGTCT